MYVRHYSAGLSAPFLFFPSGQRCRLSRNGPALFEGSEQGLALVTKTKARELLALSAGGLLSQLAPMCTVKPSSALLQKFSMGRILLPPGRVGHTAPIAQQLGIPVLATTHAAILRLEATNAALHVGVRYAESPLGRSTAPGASASWQAPVRTRLGHSCSNWESEPSVNWRLMCSRQRSRRLPTVTLLSISPCAARLPSSRCSTSRSQPCRRLTCASGSAQAVRSATIA